MVREHHPSSATDRFETQLFTKLSKILARESIVRWGWGGKKERKKSRSPGVRSWLAHCRCRADRKIWRKFGAHHGNQSITTSSSKSTFLARVELPVHRTPAGLSMLSLPGDDPMEGKKKTSIIDLMKFRTNSFILWKSYVFCWGRPVVASSKPDFQLVNLKVGSQVSSYEGFSSFGWMDRRRKDFKRTLTRFVYVV